MPHFHLIKVRSLLVSKQYQSLCTKPNTNIDTINRHCDDLGMGFQLYKPPPPVLSMAALSFSAEKVLALAERN